MTIQSIKIALPLAEVLTKYQLIPDNNNRLICPWHDDKAPSLQIYPATNTWTCFSSNCKAGSGDQIQFIQNMEKCSKREAIMIAAKWAGGEKEIMQQSKKGEQPENETDYEQLFESFRASFSRSPKAKLYAKNRHLQSTEIEIGYNAGNHAQLKHCLIFPLRDKNGKIVSLYGRSIYDIEGKKHYYTSNRQGLYPKHPTPETKTIVLTEAIIDAIMLMQYTEYEVLSLYGTNGLTKLHLEAIKGLTELEEIILFFDGDESGQKADIKYKKELVKLKPGINIKIVDTPEGEDINSLVMNHEENAEELLLSLMSGEEKECLLGLPDLPNLDSKNEELLYYTTKALAIQILGGVRLTGLDKLRVTLKITHQTDKERVIRSSLDLYFSRQVDSLLEKMVEEFEMKSSEARKVINDLTTKLEDYRLEKKEEKRPKKEEKKQLTPEERTEAINYLKDKNLMVNTKRDLGLSGLVGEENNGLIALMAYTSRKREKPLHIMFFGASGTGKTYLQERVSALIPEEDKINITSLSDNAFYYFGRKELKHKLILIEDLDGADNALYPLRELQSKREIVKTVTLKDSKGKLKTESLTVEGPVSISGCTTKEQLYEDNANRSILLYIDGSKVQDKKIMIYQQRLSAGVINRSQENKIINRLQNVQRLLKPVKVINPYAQLIDLPEEVFKPRRTLLLLLSFIETITYYHQWQRSIKKNKVTGENFIETTKEDVEIAFDLMKEVLFTKSDELSKASRSFLERLKRIVTTGNVFYTQDIRKTMRISSSTVHRYIRDLKTNGYIKYKGGNKFRGYEYQIIDYSEYENLKSTIDKKLAEILTRISK